MPVQYPETKTVDQVDTYHGVEVRDPYRWLEADVRESKEVAAWVAAENEVTFGYLEGIPERDGLREELRALWDYEKFSAPFKTGGRYFYFRNNGLQNQSVLYTMDTLEEEGSVLLDPNLWSEDGTIALAGIAVSEDGRYLAYGRSEAGSDWQTWYVMDIDSRRILDDELKWVKYSGATWTIDGKGFFYACFDEPAEGEAFQGVTLNQKLYYHRVGTRQEDDVLVHKRPDEPEWGFGADVTEDGRYLVITVWRNTEHKYRVMYRDLWEPYGMPLDLIETFENEYGFIGNEGPVFYFKTDLDAPMRRVIAIDTRVPGRDHWREIIPEGEEVISGVGLVGNLFVVKRLKDAHSDISLYTMAGEKVRDVALPSLGSAGGFGGKQTDTETFYSFSSFTTPPSIYRYDMVTGESRLIRRSGVSMDPEQYELRQVFYHSKDGTRVPMFLSHRKGLALNGNNPTLLRGYGGFNISVTPYFSIGALQWMNMGGVYAVANLRGGGEYGESWHEAGMKTNKQNVFDDFIAAAEWLIAERYTRTAKLAIAGGSNGGLLVGAVMTQRPELFGACLPAVGVMDMLRYHHFTAGRFWVGEYGSSDEETSFPALYAYSPYHNLRPGTAYPATMVTTADTDDRVIPAHSFKFAAALQAAQAGDAPVLIRIEVRAGHGGGKPTEKVIEEMADEYAFLVKVLGMDLP